jgi:4-hydroxy-3-methylbut-2-enyl diphosphate reductase
MGQLPDGAMVLIQSSEDAETVAVDTPDRLAYITQTTLSVDDTTDMISILRRRFPAIHGPKQEDICYATTNRQQAVKAIAADCDALLVVGAPNSSNSARLVEVALKAGCAQAMLVRRGSDVDWQKLKGVARLGVTAGASAPEILVEEVIEACRERFEVTIKEVTVTSEDVQFKLPRELGHAAMPA